MEPLKPPFDVKADGSVHHRLPTFGAPDATNVIPDSIYIVTINSNGDCKAGLTAEYKNTAVFEEKKPHIFADLFRHNQSTTSQPVTAAKFIWPQNKEIATLEGMEFSTNSETRILCQVSHSTFL